MSNIISKKKSHWQTQHMETYNIVSSIDTYFPVFQDVFLSMLGDPWLHIKKKNIIVSSS